MRYYTVSDAEWIRPPMKGHKEACCDCGLVHVMNYRIVKGRVEIQAIRDTKATRSRRRNKAFKNQKL